MDKPRVTPKDFFLWAGAMIALYWSVVAFILLVFNYISYAFPNALSYLPVNPYDGGVGNEMASITVMFPLYVVLMWLIRKDIAREPGKANVWVRRWALILTLFVAGATIAGDLISLLATFFSGNELTLGFLLKSVLLLLVAAGAFMHFIADFWGYWDKNPGRKRVVCYSVGVLAVLSVVAGFWMFGTPFQARQFRYDEQRVSDLQQIQYQIVNYWQSKEKLPLSLADLSDSISGFAVPTDPQTGANYVYKPTPYKSTVPNSFELCATFNAISQQGALSIPAQPVRGIAGASISDSWQHGAGEQCFERNIDPQLYPPVSKLNTK
jgi:hypothetical protein